MIRAPEGSDVVLRLARFTAPAVVLFAMAYDNGAYSLPSRSFWAIAVWWAVILVCLLWPVRAADPAQLTVGASLTALALLTLLSVTWSSSAERSVNEFNRVALYLGVFALTLLLAARISRARWCDSLGIGIFAVVVVSLTSRFAPGTFSDRGLSEVLPGASARLSFPVGYWNGLAILVALAIPLLLRAAADRHHTLVRSLAVALLPAIAVVIYLASSRGGYATAVIGAAAFVLLTRDRWWPVAALAVGGAAAALAVAMVARQSEFVNQPASVLGRDQSNTALLSLLLACVAAGAGYALLVTLLVGRPGPSRRVGVAATAGVLVALTAAAVAADPLSRFRAFRQPPGETAAGDDFVRAHLLSANGSGRWQFWDSAVDALQAEPLHGLGAGSFEAWWAAHGSLATFVRDAHSLYLEVAAELGVVGLLLLLAAFATGLLTALSRLRRLRGEEARDLAACTAVFAAFCVAAAIDWMWELTVVSVVAFMCLALMVGPLGSATPERRLTLRPAAVVGGLVVVGLLICLQAVPYLSELRIRSSQEAAARGDGAAALEAAESARAIQPWAASPWLQIALVREELGDLRSAESAIARARANDPSDWRHWLISARLQTKLGDVAAARASLRRARSLNPRSPLFSDPVSGR